MGSERNAARRASARRFHAFLGIALGCASCGAPRLQDPGAEPSTAPSRREVASDLAARPAPRPAPAGALNDITPPQLRLVLGPGSEVAPNAAVLIESDEPLHPHALSMLRASLRCDGRAVAHDLELASSRWLVLAPRQPWRAARLHELELDGVADLAGNGASYAATFLSGAVEDRAAPRCEARLLDLEPELAREAQVTPQGLSIALRTDELLHPGRVRLRFFAPITWEGERYPARAELPIWLAGEAEALRYEPPPEFVLPRGRVRLEVVVEDLAGNAAEESELSVRVVRPSERELPFDERQVIHVDFTSDRSPLGRANGRADWVEDLLRFGLLAPGDPLGLERELASELAERALARARALLGAAPAESLELRTEPPALGSCARLCVGGGDPSQPLRTLAQPSSGLLGRAPFDARNETLDEATCRLAPALGVFPGELFHAEGRRAREAPSPTSTRFGVLFAPLAPELGGTPFGEHPLDARITAPRFDPRTATRAELARLRIVDEASEALARAVGALVAHEIGHLLGLVEPGDFPHGMGGSSGFHGGIGELMAGGLEFEELIDASVELGAIERAYLSERMSLR